MYIYLSGWKKREYNLTYVYLKQYKLVTMGCIMQRYSIEIKKYFDKYDIVVKIYLHNQQKIVFTNIN